MTALRTRSVALATLAIGAGLLVLLAVLSLSIGKTYIAPGVVLDALFKPDPLNIDHILVNTTRLSRMTVAIAVGACLAVAGGLMQAVTRNPLASPGLFGINAGAVFSIVLLAPLFGSTSLTQFMVLAFAGAAVAGTLVYCIGMLGSRSPFRIVLAGAAVTALFASFTQALLVISQEGLDSILFWMAGSVAGREMQAVLTIYPYLLIGFAASLVLARHINILVTGDDIARGLGQNTFVIRSLLSIIVILLAGGAVSLAGNIGFIGLIVPHIVRRILPGDFRWLLPGYAVFGALLLLLADIVARVVLIPQEVPIGVVTALLGAPFFIHMARKGMRNG